MNPYEPPRTPTAVGLDETDSLSPGPVSCTLLERKWMQRTFQIDGPLRCQLRYDALRLRERVYQDGEVVASKLALVYGPRFEGTLRGPERLHPFVLEVRLTWAALPYAMRLQIDGCVIYHEGDTSVFDASSS